MSGRWRRISSNCAGSSICASRGGRRRHKTVMKKRVILVRHGDDPPDDRVHTYVVRSGFEPVVKKPFAGDPLGEVDDTVAGSVVYGGRFEAYAHDRFPFLKEEARWIEACMAQGVPLLGICQGAQQIADVLGAPVGPMQDG